MGTVHAISNHIVLKDASQIVFNTSAYCKQQWVNISLTCVVFRLGVIDSRALIGIGGHFMVIERIFFLFGSDSARVRTRIRGYALHCKNSYERNFVMHTLIKRAVPAYSSNISFGDVWSYFELSWNKI